MTPERSIVIPLPRSAEHVRELAEHARFLHQRYGERWLELPDTLGKPLARAEVLLASCPIATSPGSSPAAAVAHARAAGRAAWAIGETVQREGEVLEEALGTHLVELPLDRLSALVDAVLELSVSPRAETWWASPAAAKAAEVVLDAHGDDLRESARAHEAVYAQFTDRVWEIPEKRLKRGRRAWRLISRLRLRRAFAATSRTLRAPRPLGPAADLVLRARAARAQLASISVLLATHLGQYHRGPLTDADAARASLAAVRRLHDSLGDRLDAARLARLLDADAFRHEAIAEPARTLRTALVAWTTDVAAIGGGYPYLSNGPELARWSSLMDDAVPVVEAAVAAVEALGCTPATLRDLVNGLLARERFGLLAADLAADDNSEITAGGAS